MRAILLVTDDCEICPDVKEQFSQYIEAGEIELMDAGASEAKSILAKSDLKGAVPQLVLLFKNGDVFQSYGF